MWLIWNLSYYCGSLAFRPVGLRLKLVVLRFILQGLHFGPVGLRFRPVGLRSWVFVFDTSLFAIL